VLRASTLTAIPLARSAGPEPERGSQGLEDDPTVREDDLLGKFCGVSSDMGILKISGNQTASPHTPSQSYASSRSPSFGENDNEQEIRSAQNQLRKSQPVVCVSTMGCLLLAEYDTRLIPGCSARAGFARLPGQKSKKRGKMPQILVMPPEAVNAVVTGNLKEMRR